MQSAHAIPFTNEKFSQGRGTGNIEVPQTAGSVAGNMGMLRSTGPRQNRVWLRASL